MTIAPLTLIVQMIFLVKMTTIDILLIINISN